MSLIELKGISKTYYIGENLPVHALCSVSLKINPGEFVAIMGPSGSGKSTLLAILGLLDKADSGTFHLLGKDVTGLKDDDYADLRSRYLGFIFQMFNLLPRFNVIENAMLPFLYAEPSKEDNERVKSILNQIGLSDRLGHRPNELSGGQQQRVAIARALANRPRIIFADEPTGNLDSKSAKEIIGLLNELNKQGTTVIMVTHERELAENASRILTLKDGAVVSDEKIKHISPHAEQLQPGAKQKRRNPFSLAGILNYAHEAMLSLFANKLRSFLSILGVLIGVAAVIAMLAIGTGAQKQVEETLASMGSNLLMVTTSFRQRGIALGTDSVTRFTFEDLEALKKIEAVKYVVPYVNGRAQVVAGNRNWNTQVYGSSPEYQYARNAIVTTGRFITKKDVTSRAKVAVLGKAVATELFQEANPIGKQIRINRINFIVIGVLPEKGQQGFQNSDDRIVIPVTTAMYRLLGKDYINSFDIQASDAAAIDSVQAEIIPLLARLHRLSDAQTENIEVHNMAEMQQAAGDIVNTFAILLGSIAAVSLLVGGIGIMNIMLVLVMERTHEIGLRKALGAENRDIMLQFLVESVLICMLGGMLGILLGFIISFLLSSFAGWNTVITLKSILLAFTFSVIVGVIFGIWPARRASTMLPIEALRYE